MRCPFCNSVETRVLDSRPTEDGSSIRRRRECASCGGRFTTYERYEQLPVFVAKKDGRREKFNRNKLLKGIISACEKRPISLDKMEDMATDVENVISKSGKREIPSSEIGEMVMERLKKLDRIAYVRFASVYKEFRDLDHFMDIITELKDELKNR